jgi:hypothetical protein
MDSTTGIRYNVSPEITTIKQKSATFKVTHSDTEYKEGRYL